MKNYNYAQRLFVTRSSYGAITKYLFVLTINRVLLWSILTVFVPEGHSVYRNNGSDRKASEKPPVHLHSIAQHVKHCCSNETNFI